MKNNSIDKRAIHPLWLRITHWLNALAVILMVLSGWRIYNATGFLGFRIPASLTLGGWLAGALEWHFAAMWVLFATSLVYLAINLFSGRLVRKFFPLSAAGLVKDVKAALHGHLAHEDLRTYNQVQKLAYLFVLVDMTLLIASGLVLWKSVQFPHLRALLFGYEGARRVHFFAMAAMVGFFVVHVTMALLVPRTIRAMTKGR